MQPDNDNSLYMRSNILMLNLDECSKSVRKLTKWHPLVMDSCRSNLFSDFSNGEFVSDVDSDKDKIPLSRRGMVVCILSPFAEVLIKLLWFSIMVVCGCFMQ